MRKLLLPIVTVCLFHFGCAQQGDKLDSLISAYTRLDKFNGSVLVAKNGAVLLNKGYGYRNAAEKIWNTEQSVFQLGSITKQFTTAVIQKLQEDLPIYSISTITRTGLDEFLYAVADRLEQLPKQEEEIEEVEERVLYKYEKEEAPFKITRADDGAYVLYGDKIESLFRRTDFTRDQSINRFARQMRSMGVDEALRSRGAENGDTVRLLDYEFEFVD